VEVFKTLHFGPMHNLSKCRNEIHPLMLPQQRSPNIKRNSTVPGFLSLSGVQAVQRVQSLPNVNRFETVVISQYIVIFYKATKKHNQQKVDCKLWTDKHIKTSTKNLQFSDQNSSWKIVNLQFLHDREITGMRQVFET
jgi:hypothetical protein